jgi:hypothetical protein
LSASLSSRWLDNQRLDSEADKQARHPSEPKL